MELWNITRLSILPRLMMIYDYRCTKCQKVTEKSLKLSELDKKITCECGGECTRVILSVNFSLDPISGDFVTATDKWAKGRERKMAKERHNMKEHGTYT